MNLKCAELLFNMLRGKKNYNFLFILDFLSLFSILSSNSKGIDDK